MSARDALAACRTAFGLIARVTSEETVKRLAEGALEELRALSDAPSPGALRMRKLRTEKRRSSPSVTVTPSDAPCAVVTGSDAGGEGGGVFSDLKRDPDQEGEREREVPSPSVTVTHAPDRYRVAYEAGISQATGAPFAMPRKAEGELHQAIKVHAIGLRGEELLAWIRTKAFAFALMVLALPADEQRYWSNFAPPGFLRWLNAPPASATIRVAPNAPRLRPEERRARDNWEREAVKDPQQVAGAVQGLMAAIGQREGGRT